VGKDEMGKKREVLEEYQASIFSGSYMAALL